MISALLGHHWTPVCSAFILLLSCACDSHSSYGNADGSPGDSSGFSTHTNKDVGANSDGSREGSAINEWVEAGAPDQTSTEQTWIKEASNPVLSPGKTGAWDDGTVQEQSVLFNGGKYYLWYRSGKDTDFRHFGLATSADGVSWTKFPTPVLSTTTGWESAIGDPTVRHDGTEFHMWYAARAADGEFDQIAHATSSDGKAWQRTGSGPVLPFGPSGAWDDGPLRSPTVVIDGSKFHLWYLVGIVPNTPVGYATSGDGVSWQKSTKNPCAGLSHDVHGLDVVGASGDYRMVYWANINEPNGGYLHATSSDGITWQETPSWPVLNPGPLGTTDEVLYAPAIALGPQEKLWLWYAAGRDIPDSARSIHLAYEP